MARQLTADPATNAFGPLRVRHQPLSVGKCRSSVTLPGSLKALAEGIHIGADAGAIHTVITCPLPTGGTHIDTAADFIGDNPDDDVIGEPKPATLLTGLDTACIGVRGN